jgi:2-polyprenyl-3-methyl-5-hydroxy-6-metoxy-1,4-benzoquinol methylase
MKNSDSEGKIECRVCANTIGNTEFTVTEMMYGTKDKFSYTECHKCGCLQISQIPSNISNYYPDNYYSYQFRLSIKEKIKFLLKSLLIESRFLAGGKIDKLFLYYQEYLFIDFLRRNSYLSATKRVLDVGCGSGIILLQLRYLGFKSLKGVDPFISGDMDYGNGVSIDKKYLQDVDENYDLIMLNHSFEHMEDPLLSLKYIYRILSHDGFASIRIPIASSFAWRKYGVDWVQLDAPRHLFLHTTKSMEILAIKAGLEIVDIYFDSTGFQLWGSEQYAAGIPLTDPKSHWIGSKSNMFTKQQLKEYKYRANQLNQESQGDQACFILRKCK